MKNKLSKVEQLKAAILDDIRTGIYHAGDELSSIRQLCLRYHMSKQTISQALAELNQRGILNVSHGRSTRITGHPEARRIELIYNSKTSIEVQEFWGEFYRGIKEELSTTTDYELGVIQLGTEAIRTSLTRLMSPQTCGVIICGSTPDDNVWKMLAERNLPIVRIYDAGKEIPLPSSLVTNDFHAVITDIVQRFIACGRRKIAYFGTGLDWQNYGTDHYKYECFLQVIKENGIVFDSRLLMNVTHLDIEGSYDEFSELLRNGPRPDAIFLSSDLLAPGIYRAAHDAGLTIPGNLAVAGCDNLAIGRLLIPSLTSIDQRRDEMGRMAARQLLSILNGEGTHNTQTVSPQLLFRESLPQLKTESRKYAKKVLEYV